MQTTPDSQSSRTDKTTLAFPSEAVADLLRGIPEKIDPIITDDDWASPKRPKTLDADGGESAVELNDGDRSFFDRLITWYRVNTTEEKTQSKRLLPSDIRQMLNTKANQILQWKDAFLSSLNKDRLLDARAATFRGDTMEEQRNNARAQVVNIQMILEKLAADLEHATHELPRFRKRKKRNEVLYHLIYVLHIYLRFGTGKGFSPRGGSESDEARRKLAVWLCKIADPKLGENTIITAIQKAIRKPMQTAGHYDLVHESIASVWNQ